MRGVFGCLGSAAAVALGLLTTTAGRAQEKLPQPARPAARETAPPGGIHRMVIRNGAIQTVNYVAGPDVSPGDAAMLRDLESAENAATLALDLQRLKAQYVASERLLEPERRFIQSALYGQNINVATNDGYLGFFNGFGGYGGGFRFAGGYPNYAYGAYPFGGLGGGVAFSGGRSVDVNRSLANGVGDEGVLKNTLAQVIAAEATPQAMATAMRNYNAALARAGESNTLRTALGLPAGKAGAGGTRYAADEATAPVVLTLKNGQRVEGSKMTTEGDFYVVETANRRVRVLKSEVTRIEEAKPATKPAGGE